MCHYHHQTIRAVVPNNSTQGTTITNYGYRDKSLRINQNIRIRGQLQLNAAVTLCGYSKTTNCFPALNAVSFKIRRVYISDIAYACANSRVCVCVCVISRHIKAIQHGCIYMIFRCYNSSSVPKQRRTDSIVGLNYVNKVETNLNLTYALLPASLAVTKGILVSFYYYAAPTDMFKFSAYPRSSWCALKLLCYIYTL